MFTSAFQGSEDSVVKKEKRKKKLFKHVPRVGVMTPNINVETPFAFWCLICSLQWK